jgi:hypothetical protein
MSGSDPGRIDFDARMRRLFAGVDTAPGFEARVMQRVATRSAAPRADLRAQFERARASATRNLARQAWMNVATAVGVGAAGIALVWHHRLEITHAVQSGLAVAADSGVLVGIAAVVLAAGLWPTLRRYVTPL